ncbi:MAG: Nif3-like dinuclear metal center hexameric protein [Frankiaceae bacterium]
MSATASLAEAIATLERRYDPAWAEPWDAVGLVAGDPAAPVRRVHFAVDPVSAVAEEAVAAGADLLVTHHPLLLTPVHGVPATTPKGRLVHRLIRAGVALYVAHTNADVADPGVSDALAAVLGVQDLQPLRPSGADPLDKLVTFVPDADADRLIDTLATAGAGAIGNYARCAWTTTGIGTFQPGDGASPAIGRPGEIAVVPETRVEMILPRNARRAVLTALRSAHPYEEPAYDFFELAALPGTRGLGRVGELPAAVPLAEFARTAAHSLPRTVWGIRAAGDPARPVRRVAVCGGSGGDLAGAAGAAGADVLLTADLRHHPASEVVEDGGVGLVDAAHWATEAPWLALAAATLRSDLADTVTATVSTIVTDPWTVSERL